MEEGETRSSLLIEISEKEDSDSVLAKTSDPEVPVTLLTRVLYPRHFSTVVMAVI